MKPEFFMRNISCEFPQGFGVRQSSGALPVMPLWQKRQRAATVQDATATKWVELQSC